MALVLAAVTHRYRGHPALQGLDLEVPEGVCTGFIGPNGAGKTTAIRAALGLVRPASGRITVDGIDLARDPVRARAGVGALVEIPGFFESIGAEANLRRLARLRGDGGAAARERARRLIGMVGLAGAGDRPVRGFSQGMRQRLGIAQALLGSPRHLLLDEPGNGLDPDGLAGLKDLVRRLAGEGIGVLFSSHQLSDLAEVADRIVMIDAGRAILSGRTRDLVDPALLERAGRGGGLEDVYLRLRAQALGGSARADEGPAGIPPPALPPSPPPPPPSPVRIARVFRYEIGRLLASRSIRLALAAAPALSAIGVRQRSVLAEESARELAGGTLATTSGVTAFEGLAFGLSAGLPFVVLAALLAGAQTLAGETSRGTLRNLVVLPLRRIEVFAGKVLAQGALALVLTALTWGAAAGAAAWWFDYTSLAEELATGARWETVTFADLSRAAADAAELSVLPFLAASAIGVLASALAGGAVEAFGLALFFLLSADLGRALLPGRDSWFLSPAGHWPSPLGDSSFLRRFMDQAQGFSNAAAAPDPAPLGFWIAGSLAFAALVFCRRSVR